MERDTAIAIFDRLDDGGLRVSMRKMTRTPLSEHDKVTTYYAIEVSIETDMSPEELKLVAEQALKYGCKFRGSIASLMIV